MSDEIMTVDIASQHIVINQNRSVAVPSLIKKSIVQRDHNIERLTFDCPRYWYGKDISTLNIYINYISARQKAKGDDPVSSLCENVVIDENDQDMMHFDWVITNNVSQDVGGLLFLVCAKSVDSDGNEDVHWNSHLCKDLEVQEGLEASAAIVEKYPDVIEQILSKLGKQIEFRNSGKAIQYRNAGENIWTDLVQLEDIKGDAAVIIESNFRGSDTTANIMGKTGEAGDKWYSTDEGVYYMLSTSGEWINCGSGENLKKIEDEIDELKSDLGNKVGYQRIEFIDNHYIALGNIGDTVTLEPVAINNMCCVSVDCFEGDVFVVKGVGGNLPRHFGFIDANNKIIMVSLGFLTQYRNIGTELVAPKNARKLVVNCFYDYDYFLYKGISNDSEKSLCRDKCLNNKVADIDGIIADLCVDNFRLSNTYMFNEGKSFTYYEGNTYLCLKNQYMFDLEVGDIISLQSYSTYRIYVYKLGENNFDFIGWKYSDFVVSDKGKYGFVIGKIDNSDISQTEINSIISLISIIRPSNKLRDIENKIISSINGALIRIISANDSLEEDKNVSNYVCTGVGDGMVIQNAIDELVELGGGKIILKKGRYYLDRLGFEDHQNETYGNSVIFCNVKDKCVTIESEIVNQNDPVSDGQELNTGAQLYVTNELYESMSVNEIYSVFNCAGMNYEGGIILKNFGIVFPYNQKRIIGLDMLHFNGICRCEGIYVNAYNKTYNGSGAISSSVIPAVDGCIGIRTICKTSIGAIGTKFSNCVVKGCYDGFSINSEHNILSECAAIFCVYGYSFLKHNVGNGQHPNLLLRCMDERNVNLPKFYRNDHEQCNMILGLNIERKPSISPGGSVGLFATEEVIGQNRGEVTYTYTDERNSLIKDDIPFWESGHGHGFTSKNLHHLQSCNTLTRLSYAPNFMQRVFDTDLNKEVICIDESVPTWVDCMGDTVDNN